MRDVRGLLPGLPAAAILARMAAAPGNEVASGKFLSPESSSALAVNGFGWFQDRPEALPAIAGQAGATSVLVERELRLPWRGGRHPWLDAVVETADALIGIESKRYEPFRSKGRAAVSDAYFRPVWHEDMCRWRKALLCDPAEKYVNLDWVQLCKHALALETQGRKRGLLPVLVYLYAEPTHWADSRPIGSDAIARHRCEVARFADAVSGQAVAFVPMTWRALLEVWSAHGGETMLHARRVGDAFAPI